MTGSAGSLLDVQGLKTCFDTDAGTITAVDGVSFTIRPRETIALVGESGSGKSVTAMSLVRLIPPPGRIVAGKIFFEGVDLVQASDRHIRSIRGSGIALVFQDANTYLNPVLTIGTQISEAVRIHERMSSRAALDKACDLLDMVGIASPATTIRRYPHEMSGGMNQRVMIAIALSCSPRLLVADEPTTALDVTVQAQVMDLLVRLVGDLGMSMCLITHNLALVAGRVDRVYVMYAGHIVETGPVRPVFADALHPYTRALLASIPRLDEDRRERLSAIQGSPPNMIARRSACPFEPRCPLSVERCRVENPPLTDAGQGRAAACWVTVPVGECLS